MAGESVQWYETYQVYLCSDKWREIRAPILERAEGRCEICYVREHLEVHHIVYPQFHGQEAPGTLAALCSGCHTDIHMLQKTGVARRESFKQVLAICGQPETLTLWRKVGPAWLRRPLCLAWLSETLDLGPYPSKALRELATRNGVCGNDLQWAKRNLGAISKQRDGVWCWEHPWTGEEVM